jgi:hypothetical protein
LLLLIAAPLTVRFRGAIVVPMVNAPLPVFNVPADAVTAPMTVVAPPLHVEAVVDVEDIARFPPMIVVLVEPFQIPVPDTFTLPVIAIVPFRPLNVPPEMFTSPPTMTVPELASNVPAETFKLPSTWVLVLEEVKVPGTVAVEESVRLPRTRKPSPAV